MKKQAPEKIIDFHKKALKEILDLYIKNGLDNTDAINSYNAMDKLTDSLWKIPEAAGKNNQRYISEGVKKIVDAFSRNLIIRPKNAKSLWTPRMVKKAIDLKSNIFPESIEDFKTQLEHVVPKIKIVSLLLENPSSYKHIIDSYNKGCTVLASEHEKLNDDLFDVNDIWIRYKAAEIRVWDTKNNVWVF